MNEALAKARRYRHVVFPDSIGGHRRAVDLAPRQWADRSQLIARPPEKLPEDAELLFRSLFSRAGLNFRDYRPETLARRLPACLRAVWADSPAQARAALRRHPHSARAALDAVLIGVTAFFRDEAVFEWLRRRTLPALVARGSARRADGDARPLRVWSAGCSDGAELYGVAMLLVEQGALAPGGVELLGTDCRGDAIERAGEGVFEPAAVRGVSPALLRRYFSFDGERYRVQRALRAAATWKVANVLGEPEPGPWDLVLCRNLAIYLQPGATASLWESLAAVVAPGGALVLGKAERPAGIAGLTADGPCTYRRVTRDGAAT